MSDKNVLFMARTTRFHEFVRTLGTTMGAELGSLRISGSYDPLGEAGKAAVAAKRGEASGGDFTRSIPTRAAR